MADATFKTSIDIPAATREVMVKLCNQQLADTFDLYSQTKQAHWNVKGPEFIALHLLFDDLAEQVLPFADSIAERATALGGLALGTARMAAENSTLPEFPVSAVTGMDNVKELTKRYSLYAASSRKAIDTAEEVQDISTSDLFTEISRAVDKSLWFLEAHLQG